MAVAAKGGLRVALRERPILWAVVVCFTFETGMNAIFGYRQAGGGVSLAAWLYGAIFIALAFLGAWSCVELFKIRGADGTAWARRAAFGIPFAGCLAVSQFSGWGVLGVTLADGSALRTVAATSASTAAEALAAKRAERAALSVTRSADAIRAELDLELRKTSRAYPSGDGPNAMQLKAALADVERAHALDQEIQEAMATLESKPAVASGNPEFAVVTGWTGATPETVRKLFSVGLVALIGGFANFGFALAGVGREPVVPRSAADEFLARMDWGPRRLTTSAPREAQEAAVRDFDPLPPEAQIAALEAKLAEARRLALQTPPSPEPPMPREPITGWPRPAFPPSIERHGGDPRGEASFASAVHGAPITINLTGGAPQPAVGPAPLSVPSLPPPAAGGGRAYAAPHALAAGEVDAVRPLHTGPPVDRLAVRGRLDHLLLFRQACLAPLVGSLVSAEAMYAAYADWAGPRAMSRPAFLGCFGELASVAETQAGGLLHFCDVALLEAQPREVRA